ncbi:MAG: tetratricopeptide repeat protein [Muribaculaceae bacterium]|nr:tetratricopeptide repeat protein [Muribaculaceae bacterium]
MNRIRFHHILFWIAAVAMLLPMVATGRDNGGISDADRRKASYMFLEAQNWKSREVSDAYFDLVRRAYETDTTNTTAAFYFGHALLTMRGQKREHYERGLALLKKHFDACPDDFYETILYSDACLMLGEAQQALTAIERLCQSYPNKLELQSRLAEAYSRTGDYVKSNATLDSIELHHGQSIGLTTKKISNYIELNDTASSIAEMRRLLASAPRNARYNMGMAGVMQQFGMADSALHYLNVAQEVEPSNGYTYLAKAQFYQEVGDSAAYDQQIQHALTTDNLDIDDKLGLLTDCIRESLSKNDTTQRVEQLFGVLLEQHPHEADIHQLYTEYLLARKNYKAAAEQQGYVLDINPTDASGWHRLMVLNVMNDDYPAAIRAAERALEFNPDSVELYSYIAPMYFQTKDYAKAMAIYERALSMTDSTDVETRSDLLGGMADVIFEQGDTLRAFDTYEQALTLNPLNAGALNNYAYFLSLCERDLDKAERMAATAIKLYPQSATYLDTYAWVLFKKGDIAGALTQIRAAIEADDEPSADLLDHYGDILEANGEHDLAREQWKRALEIDPDNKELKRKVK